MGLPIGGMTSIDFAEFTFWEKVVDLARHMVLPVIVLSTGTLASLMRYMRSNLLDVLRQDYVTTARAKGLAERVVIYKHAVRNAINPLITIFGFQLGGILGEHRSEMHELAGDRQPDAQCGAGPGLLPGHGQPGHRCHHADFG